MKATGKKGIYEKNWERKKLSSEWKELWKNWNEPRIARFLENNWERIWQKCAFMKDNRNGLGRNRGMQLWKLIYARNWENNWKCEGIGKKLEIKLSVSSPNSFPFYP